MTGRTRPERIVFEVGGDDYITCRGQCRATVGIGRVCRCPARTKGPCVESPLTRIVDGAVRVTGSKVGKRPR